MPVRLLDARDLPRIAEIARHGMEFDEVNEPVIAEKTVNARDYDPVLGIVFEDNGRVVGFAQSALGMRDENRSTGYVRLLVVDPAHRMKSVGSALLNEAETRLKAKGATSASIMDCPQNYFMPGVDFRNTEAYCFLQKHGYRMIHENHNLLCNLDAGAWPELDAQAAGFAADNIEVRRAVRDDEAGVFEFIAQNWPAWRDEVEGTFMSDPATLYVALRDGKTVAFSGYQGNNRALNWFGPMGTCTSLRGKGIGGILLRLCLRDLARQGWRTAIIPWVGPVRFYARYCGARLDRCFWVFRKDI